MWGILLLIGFLHQALSVSQDVVYTTGKLSPQDYEFLRGLPTPRASSSGYKYKYVSSDGAIHTSKPSSRHSVQVAATLRTSEKGHYEAALICSYMVRHMPSTVFERLATRSKGIGIFAHGEGLSAYPEMANTKDSAACRGRCDGSCKVTCTFDGRKWDTVAGSGGSRALVLEDNVLCLSSDPYRHKYNVLIHEFGHNIKFYGAESAYRSKLTAAFANAKNHHIYGPSYALSNEDEYFAEGTSGWFNVNHQNYDGGLTECNHRYCKDEIESRLNIKQHTPDLFEILNHIYNNGNMNLRSGLKICQSF
ncbi:uncharacterized protein LOC126829683 [Patella vulgata]|uniref:uncharacterized protein LOC126829683 n=1 Tax=Patella vulgata TaxID=6465 RepID=UPI00217FD101|nr:uncharacterized protein LOC126829683 [Patella vulgata]